MLWSEWLRFFFWFPIPPSFSPQRIGIPSKRPNYNWYHIIIIICFFLLYLLGPLPFLFNSHINLWKKNKNRAHNIDFKKYNINIQVKFCSVIYPTVPKNSFYSFSSQNFWNHQIKSQIFLHYYCLGSDQGTCSKDTLRYWEKIHLVSWLIFIEIYLDRKFPGRGEILKKNHD